MPRKKLISTSAYPYHVIARTNNRQWFATTPSNCWNIFSDYLFFISRAFDAEIHAFVLMANHFHLMMSTPNRNIGMIMNRFMTEVSQTINVKSDRINHVFGGRYKGCLITDGFYYANCLKYIYRNPVKASVVPYVEDYEYSSIHGLIGRSTLGFPVLPCKTFKAYGDGDIFDQISWYNNSFEEAYDQAIKNALVKTEFRVPVKRTSDVEYRLSTSFC